MLLKQQHTSFTTTLISFTTTLVISLLLDTPSWRILEKSINRFYDEVQLIQMFLYGNPTINGLLTGVSWTQQLNI